MEERTPRRPRIADVAREAGVSKTAVSFAFNSPDRLAPETASRIRDVADSLGYRPHPVARMLTQRSTHTLGVLTPQALSVIFSNPFFGAFSEGVALAAEQEGYALHFISPLHGSLARAMGRATVDGVVAVGLAASHPEVEQIRAAGVPLVMVDSSALPDQPGVEVDDEGGARAAAEHLLGLGHRDILIVGVEPPTPGDLTEPEGVTARRMRGYVAALARARPGAARERGGGRAGQHRGRHRRHAARLGGRPPTHRGAGDVGRDGDRRPAGRARARPPGARGRLGRGVRRHRHQPAHEPPVDHGAPADPPEGRERGAPAPVRRRTTGSTPGTAPARDAAHRPRLDGAGAAQAAGGGPDPTLRTRGRRADGSSPGMSRPLWQRTWHVGLPTHGSRAGPARRDRLRRSTMKATRLVSLEEIDTRMKTKMRLVALFAGAAIFAAACGGSSATPSPAATAAPATAAPATTAPESTAPESTAPESPAAEPLSGEITLWHSYGSGGGETGAFQKALGAILAANKDLVVHVVEQPFSDIFTKWQTDVLAGGGPDMYVAPNDNLFSQADAGALADVTAALEGKLEGFNQVAVDGSKVDGKMFMVPESLKAVAMWYDKSKVTAAPASAQALLDAVKAGTVTLGLNQNAYHNFGLSGAFGGTLMDDTGKCVADATTGWADSYKYMADLKAAGAKFYTDGNALKQDFQTGKLNAVFDGPWQTADFSKALGENLAVAPIPAGTAPANPLTGTDGWYINPNSKNMDLAVALALQLVGTSSEQILTNDAGHVPAAPGVTISSPHRPGLRRRGGRRPPAPAARRVQQLLGPLRRRPQPRPRQGRGPHGGHRDRLQDHERGEQEVAFVPHHVRGRPRGAPGSLPERAPIAAEPVPGPIRRPQHVPGHRTLEEELRGMATAAAVAPVPRRRRNWRRSAQPYLYLVPALVVMAIITFYPLMLQVWMSFTDFGPKNFRVNNPIAPNFVGIDNYIRIATSQLQIPNFEFIRLVLFNLWWAFCNVVVHVVLGVLVAVVLNTKGLMFRGVYRALFILPVVIPSIIVATVWRKMFDTDAGAVNFLMQGVGGIFGIPADAPGLHLNWLRQVDDPIPFIPLPLAYFAMITANTWLGWPLNAVVATGALQSIPGDLYEAAEMDGANAWQKFRTITITYLRPAMLPYAIYGFVITFNLFFLPYFMTGGEPFGRTEILVTQAYRLAVDRQLFGVAAAFAVYLFFLLLAVTLVTNQLAKATKSYAD